MLYGKKVKFHLGSLEEVPHVSEPLVDILIMVNWLHDVDPATITSELQNLLKSKRNRFILVDEIPEEVAGFSYKHDFEDYFRGTAKKIKELHYGGDQTRKLILLEVT